MLKRIIGIIVIIIVVATALIGVYLSPDDIATCDTGPNARDICHSADAIVALSGGNTDIRAAEAIKLYKQGWAPLLIFSGAALDEDSPSNASVMMQQAIDAGVPSKAIITDDNARTTHQNAEYTDEIINRYHIARLIVVTSPYHQRRAGLEFSRIVGPSVQIINHPTPNDPDWPWYWWATPRGWWLAGGELIKIGFTHAGESE